MTTQARWLVAALATLAVAGGTATLLAQQVSLADVARKEAERRKEITKPAKVYTNKDLGNVPPAPPVSASQVLPPAPTPAAAPPPEATSPAADAAKQEDSGKDEDEDEAAEPVKDRAYWSGRLKRLEAQLDRDQTYAEALQSRISALTADFTARDDPAQRAVIERDRRKALDELDRLTQVVQDDKKAISALQEDARRAGVPPGWLRF